MAKFNEKLQELGLTENEVSKSIKTKIKDYNQAFETYTEAGSSDETLRISLEKLDDKIVVKIPMIREGVKAIRYFHSEGIRTNCTLIFSSGQALLAAKAGATYVSPFIGRLDDISFDGLDLIGQIVHIYQNFGYETEVLAASVRHSMHLIKCAELGADVVTCPLKVITGLLKHPLTDSGLAQFLADHAKAAGK